MEEEGTVRKEICDAVWVGTADNLHMVIFQEITWIKTFCHTHCRNYHTVCFEHGYKRSVSSLSRQIKMLPWSILNLAKCTDHVCTLETNYKTGDQNFK